MPILLALVLVILVYAFIAFCLMRIAGKLGANDPWRAWVPVLNLLLLVEIAGKPWWWMLLILIPCLGFIFAAIVWMGVCEARGKPSWLGLLMLVPIGGIFLLPYLAFSE